VSLPARAVLLAALLGLPLAARADSLYVVEQIVVSVNSSADGSGERVGSLKSGDKVELLGRSGESAHVRLADGKDGWLRASYLSADEPLRARLQRSEAEVARQSAPLNSLQTQPTPTSAAHAAAAAPAAAEEVLPASAAPLFSSAPESSTPARWPWLSLGALAGVAGGFALGWYTLDRTIRRKYGGLKVY
jgi:hypothetical protein